MSRQDRYSRRKLLGATGTAAMALSAGCLEGLSSEGNGSGTQSDYRLEVSSSDIDLTDLKTSEMEGYSQEDVKNEYSSELEIEIYEAGHETDLGPDSLDDFYVELDYKEDIEQFEEYVDEVTDDSIKVSLSELPEFLVKDGETVKVYAEQDGQKLEAETTVEKVLPDLEETGYILEGHLWKAGEKIYETPHQDSFQFNTIHIDYEEYQEKRIETIEEFVRPDRYQEAVEEAMERKRDHEIEEILNSNTDKIERDKQVSNWIYTSANRIVGRHSSNADSQAATEEMLLRNLRQNNDGEIYFADTHTEDTEHQIFTDVYSNGFNNPHDQTSDRDGGNHGSKIHYIDGDWYHSETVRQEIKHVDNKEEIGMVNGRNQHFVSVIGEIEQGSMAGLSTSNKLHRQNAAFYGNVFGHGAGIETEGFILTDTYAPKGLEMKRNNEPRLDIYAAPIIAAEHARETGSGMITAGTPENAEIITTNQEDIFLKLRQDLSIQDRDSIKQEVLN